MRLFVPPDLYGIIGKPLAHSLSPLLHTAAFRALGIPGVLLPWELEMEQIPAFIEAMKILNIRGACVTIPHKQAVIPFLDGLSDRARLVGAVNLIHRDGGRVLGDNTDVPGFLAPLKRFALPPAATALILGAGGAARAVAVALKSLSPARIAVAGRTRGPAESLAADFGLDSVDWEARGTIKADLVINATPLGMKGEHAAGTPYRSQWMTGKNGIAYDIVYAPRRTRFIREAAEAGWKTINGLEMFLAQADHQFTTWTGRSLPTEARQLAVDALEA